MVVRVEVRVPGHVLEGLLVGLGALRGLAEDEPPRFPVEQVQLLSWGEGYHFVRLPPYLP